MIGRPDAKWGERPVLIVEPREGSDARPGALLACLRGKVADWWIPDQVVVVQAMPLAATGKIDKKRLRADVRRQRLTSERCRSLTDCSSGA